MNNRFYTILGLIATVTAVAMYVSYIHQIANNLKGLKRDGILPLVAAINCTSWVTYRLLRKPKKDVLGLNCRSNRQVTRHNIGRFFKTMIFELN
ncbi:hypothetical protein OHD16_15510 [Sphingobacterium sp. ML3W]|uniref:hypothetical protein n=1 Tax=Sphingobacterium sp. ML3W TaxID=1538644 RepID=UPI00249B78F1|nr:hypothetical protein [Sphingobacterium sp. ML3W]WFA81361.1 hypothetical protein OGI71_08650 [Sphingobacterium sp. ML3W]